MPDYEKLYHILFNAAADASELLPDGDEARELLIRAQLQCEDLVIEEEEDEPPR